jgi:hypothetical protein
MARESLLAWGFLGQLLVPLVLAGSTAAGAVTWVLASIVLFLLPACLLTGSHAVGAIDRVAAYAFLPPAIFIGIANISNGNFEPRDVVDLFRAPYFLVAFLAGAKLASMPGLLERVLARTFPLIAAALFTYLVASFAARNAIDDLELWYGKIDNVVSARLFGPFSNPYDLALFCTFPLIYCMLAKRWALTLVFAAVLVATQSRTGIILCATGLLFCATISRNAQQGITRWVMPAIVIGAGLLVVFLDEQVLMSMYLVSNTLGLFEGHSTTLARRFAQWRFLQDLPWLGWGTVRSSELVIENAVIYEFYRTGVMGVYTLICFYAFPVILALKTLLSNGRDRVQIALAVFVILTVVGFSASVFIYQPKLSLLYWVASGALFVYATSRQVPAGLTAIPSDTPS